MERVLGTALVGVVLAVVVYVVTKLAAIRRDEESRVVLSAERRYSITMRDQHDRLQP
jgi:hypothetical protein